MTLGKRELKLLKEVAPLRDYAASVEGEYRQAELYLHALGSALAVMDRLEKEFYGSATKAELLIHIYLQGFKDGAKNVSADISNYATRRRRM